MRKFIINVAAFAVVGATAGSLVASPMDWQFWVLIAAIGVVQINSEIDS